MRARQSADGCFPCAAFVPWRLNWIHPFADGNGRVARGLCYVALCVVLGEVVAGDFLILLLDRCKEYYEELESADREWASSDQDYSDPRVVSAMEDLLADLYASL